MSRIQRFEQKMEKLLEMEQQEDVDQTQALLDQLPDKDLIGRGLMVKNLTIVEQRSGFGGKLVVVLQSFHGDVPLSPNKFGPGDIVSFKDESSGERVESGVLVQSSEKKLEVAINSPNERDGFLNSHYSLIQLTNTVTYKRMNQAVKTVVAKYNDLPIGQLVFTDKPPNQVLPVEFEPVNTQLNQSQYNSIAFALGSKEVALIHGPPGTGKTTAITELIIQCVKRGERVLAVAPSNIAIDNIAERLIRSKQVTLLRIGHPARSLPVVVNHCLDMVVEHSNGGEVLRGIHEDLNEIQKEIQQTRGSSRTAKRREWSELKKELKRRELKATQDIIRSVNVVLATCTGAADKHLRGHNDFDVVIIDEAGQALEAQCWIALVKGKKAVLAGDHCQLPPTIHSEKASSLGLNRTLFERLIHRYGDTISSLLSVQYRMNERIMRWSSDIFYKSKLTAHESVKSYLLKDLSGVAINYLTTSPLVFIDTIGSLSNELSDSEGSKYNEGEALLVQKYIEQLLLSHVPANQIAVISPYYAQVKLLRESLYPRLSAIEINTVDGFQGREKQVIIISMVRSNELREVGFLAEERRMNVAVTRAQRQCCIIGDSDTISSNKFLGKLLNYFEENGEYLSSMQFADGDVKTLSLKPLSLQHNISKPPESTSSNSSPQKPAQSATKENVLDRVHTFYNSAEEVFNFGRPLSAADESAVFAESEKLGLYAAKVAHKRSKFIELRRVPWPESDDETIQDSAESIQADTISIVSPPSSQSVPPTLKTKNKIKPKSTATPSTANNKAPGRPASVIAAEINFKNMTEEEVLAAATRDSSWTRDHCHFPGCKYMTIVNSYICHHCNFKFCIKHMCALSSLPEVHGCSARARGAARAEFKQQSQIPPQKKLSTANRTYLSRKLNEKIAGGSSSRQKEPTKAEAKKETSSSSTSATSTRGGVVSRGRGGGSRGSSRGRGGSRGRGS